MRPARLGARRRWHLGGAAAGPSGAPGRL